MVMEKESKWLQSKLVQFMAIYWGVIIVLTKLSEWVSAHEASIKLMLTFAGLGLGLFVGWTLAVVLFRRSREW